MGGILDSCHEGEYDEAFLFNELKEKIEDYVDEATYDCTMVKQNRLQIKSVKAQMDRVYMRKSVLFCIDIEAWEHDSSEITEIGLAIYDPRRQKLALAPNIENLHLVIHENQHLRNGRYVEDNRSNFMGEDSWNISMENARKLVQSLIDRYFGSQAGQKFPCAFTGHDVKGDLKWLKELGISVPHHARELDTQKLYSYTHGRDGASLKNCLRAVNQPAGYLHNAGNDAYYTILLALKLCDPEVRMESGFIYDLKNNVKPATMALEDLIRKYQ